MLALSSFHEPGVWLVISALCGVALVAGWSFAPDSWRAWLALAYWVAIPYLALLAGAVSPRLMGLRFLDWSNNFQAGTALFLVLVILAGVARLLTMAPQRSAPSTPGLQFATWTCVGAVVVLCGAEEFFWSFLRGALWEIALTLPLSIDVPAYWAVWIAALLALPLALIVQPSTPRRLVKIATLMVTTVVFFYTRNFWLCWLLHAAIWILLVPLPHRVSLFAAVQSDDQ
jgi:hypothetical protein